MSAWLPASVTAGCVRGQGKGQEVVLRPWFPRPTPAQEGVSDWGAPRPPSSDSATGTAGTPWAPQSDRCLAVPSGLPLVITDDKARITETP